MKDKVIAWTIMKGVPTSVMLGRKILISGKEFQTCFLKHSRYQTHEMYIQLEMIFSTKFEATYTAKTLNKKDI